MTILHKKDGGRISLPLVEDPFQNPLDIHVASIQINKNQPLKDSGTLDYADADILILSPEDGAFLRPDEVVISASLFNAPSVDQSQFQIFIDNQAYIIK